MVEPETSTEWAPAPMTVARMVSAPRRRVKPRASNRRRRAGPSRGPMSPKARQSAGGSHMQSATPPEKERTPVSGGTARSSPSPMASSRGARSSGPGQSPSPGTGTAPSLVHSSRAGER